MAKTGTTPELEHLYDVLEDSVEKMSDTLLEEFRWLILDEQYVRRQCGWTPEDAQEIVGILRGKKEN
jgi:hypothetical protein